MNEAWTIAQDATEDERHAFASLAAVFELTGELITGDPLSQVLRVSLNNTRYYLKRYTRPAKDPLRYWLGRPRVRAEWENLQAFADWGIPTARLVAWGLERRFGKFVRGAMITQEIVGTRDLADMARNHDPRLRDARWVAGITRQVADITRIMHTHSFTHNDLKWRNILATNQTPPRAHMIDCPAGMVWFEPFLSYRKIKDLACLDKVAKHVLSRSQRLRFYLRYCDRARLTAQDKRRIGKILAFFRGRE